MCDSLSRAECVLTFDCESKRKAFMRDFIEGKDSHIFCAAVINEKTFPRRKNCTTIGKEKGVAAPNVNDNLKQLLLYAKLKM